MTGGIFSPYTSKTSTNPTTSWANKNLASFWTKHEITNQAH